MMYEDVTQENKT